MTDTTVQFDDHADIEAVRKHRLAEEAAEQAKSEALVSYLRSIQPRSHTPQGAILDRIRRRLWAAMNDLSRFSNANPMYFRAVLEAINGGTITLWHDNRGGSAVQVTRRNEDGGATFWQLPPAMAGVSYVDDPWSDKAEHAPGWFYVPDPADSSLPAAPMPLAIDEWCLDPKFAGPAVAG